MRQVEFEALYGRSVSRETFQRLERFVALVLKWQKSINLIAPSTIESIWTRHVLDSAFLFTTAIVPRSWIDIGSGGGFPGLVVAILAIEETAQSAFHLVESNGKKAAFLREAAREIAPNATVHQERAEIFLSGQREPGIVSARALAPLVDLVTWSRPLLIKGALGLFMKGQEVQLEIEVASRVFPDRYAVRSNGVGSGGAAVAVWQGSGCHPLMFDPKGWT
jgi:16S rRNA (guanine527-N7)-methyltransferase